MPKEYCKSEIEEKISSYFKGNECKYLYNDDCINYRGITKDTKECYTKVIVDYLVKNISEFKKQFENITITRKKSYRTEVHDEESDFNFLKNKSDERREEKIAHAMYCQYCKNQTVFGKILDYQIPLKNRRTDCVGKIDLLSHLNEDSHNKIYFLELKKDNSDETLLRCILEAYTYFKIVDTEKLCKDFFIPTNKNNVFIIAPLVYKDNDYGEQLQIVKPLIDVLDFPVELFVWQYDSGFYKISPMNC